MVSIYNSAQIRVALIMKLALFGVSLDMPVYAHTLMQDAHNANAIRAYAVDDDVGAPDRPSALSASRCGHDQAPDYG
jgi:hypothetical protein